MSQWRPDDEKDDNLGTWLASPRLRVYAGALAERVASYREQGERDACDLVAESRCEFCAARALDSVFLAGARGSVAGRLVCDACTLAAARAFVGDVVRGEVAALRADLPLDDQLVIVCRPGELPTLAGVSVSPHMVRAIVGRAVAVTWLREPDGIQLHYNAELLPGATGEVDSIANRFVPYADRKIFEGDPVLGTFVISARGARGAARSLSDAEAVYWLTEIATWPMASYTRRADRARQGRRNWEAAERKKQHEEFMAEVERRGLSREPWE